MKIIAYQVFSGKKNMDFDEKLLEEVICSESEPVLRFYGWDEPTLSFGKNQIMPVVTKFPSVKRITGGKTLLHDKELTYSFVCRQDFLKNGESVINSYKEISNGLILGFQNLGVKLEFPENKKISIRHGYCMNISTGSDLSYQGKKIIGSAQARKKGCILQHGSILLDYDKKILEETFDEKVEGVISLKEINPELCDISFLCEAIKKGFEQNFDGL